MNGLKSAAKHLDETNLIRLKEKDYQILFNKGKSQNDLPLFDCFFCF